jgi:hypothetical protein
MPACRDSAPSAPAHFALPRETQPKPDAGLRFARTTDAIAAEAATDGIYVVRTSLAEDTLGDAETARSYKSLSLVERGFRCIKTVDLHVRPVYHRIGSAEGVP